MRLFVDSWRWQGVPFYVRAGKCLHTTSTEIVVNLKEAPPVVFRETSHGDNYVRFTLAPNVAIDIGASAKRPGEGMTGDPVTLSVVATAAQGQGTRLGPYERLLGDAMTGDATLFARQDVVEAAWAIVDPVLNAPNTTGDVRVRKLGTGRGQHTRRRHRRLDADGRTRAATRDEIMRPDFLVAPGELTDRLLARCQCRGCARRSPTRAFRDGAARRIRRSRLWRPCRSTGMSRISSGWTSERCRPLHPTRTSDWRTRSGSEVGCEPLVDPSDAAQAIRISTPPQLPTATSSTRAWQDASFGSGVAGRWP